MKKKFLAIAAATVLTVAITFTGCSGGNSSETSNDPLADGVLNIGTEATYVPLEYRDENNDLVGFDIDLGAALAEELGVTVEWEDTSFDGIFTGLDARQYDAVIAGSITPERQENMTLSSPYIANGIVIVSRNDGPQGKTAQDLSGKVAGVQISTTADTAAEAIKTNEGIDYEVRKYDSILEAFSALEGGTIDYVITDKPVGEFYCAQNPDAYNVSSETLSNEPVGIATRKDDAEFSEKIENALQTLRDNGTLKELSEKWFGEDVTENISMDLSVIE